MRARIVALGALATLACAPSEPAAPPLLSDWGLFADMPTLTPADGVLPYDVSAPLYSDHATKHRFMRIPPGEQIVVGDDGRWVFPEGSVLVKTFGFREDATVPGSPERLIETRLLVLTDGVWRPYPYVWNAEQTDARYSPATAPIHVGFVDENGQRQDFDYQVPTRTLCGNCHGGTGPIEPIGPRTEQLDHLVTRQGAEIGQLEWLMAQGVLSAHIPDRGHALPNPFDPSLSPTEAALTYLEANCAHCHREGGAAHQSGLWLDESLPVGASTGVCKAPVAVTDALGRCVDIAPRDPDASLLLARMRSVRAGIRMPESGVVTLDDAGIRLVERWISSMDADDCGGALASCDPSRYEAP